MIDLRSDTITRPSREMLEVMMKAEVGDDVFGEDPTVNQLEHKAARLFGKEAGLFCPSGTMTNQIAIQVHTKPGDEVICHEMSHIYHYEGGGVARNSLSSVKLVRNEKATMRPEEIEDLINDDYDWLARTSLVVAEDTSNRGGGKCYSREELQDLSKCCKQNGLALHLDGARAFNAIVKEKHDPAAYGSLFDSISICLSKGLGAPVGSVLLGSAEFIKEARRVRKVMGGGMRQAGILAAAGIYALDNNLSSLEKDHSKAQSLAENLSGYSQVTKVIKPETNILLFDVNPEHGAAFFLKHLESKGLKAIAFGKNRIRITTHRDFHESQLESANNILKAVLDKKY
jgi:threonine aldolase